MHQQQTAFENIVGKEEIAHNEQFFLFPQCFLLNQINVSPFIHISDIIFFFAAEFEKPKIGISGKGLTCDQTVQLISTQSQILMTPEEKAFNHCEKRSKQG